MEMSVELRGVEESLENMARLVAAEEKAVEDALEWVLEKMCNYAKSKEGGNYKDHTSNLRNSISINVETMKEYPADTAPSVLKNLVKQNETPVIKVEGDDYYGVLSAGMNYAIWVELAGSGKRVLQGAIDKFEPLIEQYMAGFLAVEKLDLIHVADIQYSKFLKGKGLSDTEISSRIKQKHEEYGR